MNSSIKLLLLLVLSGLLSAGCAQKKAEPITFSKEPYFFDFGGEDSELAKGKYQLMPSFHYSEENGYGWVSEGVEPYLNERTEKSRDAFLIDGVSAKVLEFKADIPSGDWRIALWYELGLEDSSTTRIFINQKNTTPGLQTFTPAAEQNDIIPKVYRVLQQKIKIENDGITIKMEGRDDIVRLLGIALIPEPQDAESDPKLASVMEDIREVGTYNSERDFEPVISELDKLSGNPEYQNFVAYWKLQLEIMRDGEKYFYYRGWSKRTEETGMGLFDHIHQAILLYDGMLTADEIKQNPLYERALWYNGRLLYWLWLEGGSYRERDAGLAFLKDMQELHPDDELVRMYNGDKIDIEDRFDNVKKPANAPGWAFAEWELMNRLKSIADWWVLEQQSETGEFGGKFGDDVEILRWWSPLILSGDAVAYQGWKKLADGVWNSSKVYKGYAKTPSDVEHSSEFMSDTAPLMVLFSDDSVYADRLAYSADYFKNLWSGYNDNGNRFFKSAWFSSTEIETEPPKNRDVAYNTRATKTVRYYAWKSRDKETIEALKEWADSWLAVSQQTTKGKPLGIIPPSVAFPSGEINGPEDNWYTANMFWDYFDWNGSSAILDELLYTWTLTGEEKYLLPINQHLELVTKYKDEIDNTENNFEEGSEGWAAYMLGNSDTFWNVIGTWRLLIGDQSYDSMITEHGTPFIKYRLTGNEDFLVEGIKEYLETVRYNTPMLTTEGIHTDRIFIKGRDVREAGILQGMVTGYGIAESSSPYIAVSWENASRDLTFLVTGSDSSHVDMDIYSFSSSEETATMRLWQLKPGAYTFSKSINGSETENKQIEVKKGGDRFDVDISPQKTVQISIKRTAN